MTWRQTSIQHAVAVDVVEEGAPQLGLLRMVHWAVPLGCSQAHPLAGHFQDLAGLQENGLCDGDDDLSSQW